MTSPVFDRLIYNIHKYRTFILQGGTSSTKTYSIIQLFWALAMRSKIRQIFSIVSETMPHLKRGAIRDFMDILGEDFERKKWNATDFIYKANHCIIEFFSADQESRCRGGRRDWLFINEVNNIRQETRNQLEVRTRKKEFMDFNPTTHFWGHELQGNKGVYFDVSTYKDNPFLEQSIIDSIEQRRETDPDWFRVYGLGLTGHIQGIVYPHFTQVNSMPDVPTVFGLDFGYTNDPTALIEVGFQGNDMYLREHIYQTGMTNRDISEKLLELGLNKKRDVIFADSAEPKSIHEIWLDGWDIRPSLKGADSVNVGIDYAKRFNIKITKDSLNTVKEIRNYSYQKDKEGRWKEQPIRIMNHAMDAFRYANSDLIAQPFDTAIF